MNKTSYAIAGTFIVLGMAMSLASTGCGTPNVAGGCSVNGTYYPHGNAPNGQCVCPPIGSCTISFASVAVPTPPLRSAFTATRLSTGQVVLAGGQDEAGNALDTAELYDPSARKYLPLQSRMTTPRTAHLATLLPDGRIALTGGRDASGTSLNDAEIFDPESRTFTRAPAP